ncbi:MAG: murein L,D-transpeptidase catalytic domain family protein [Bacteroidia bacterium]
MNKLKIISVTIMLVAAIVVLSKGVLLNDRIDLDSLSAVKLYSDCGLKDKLNFKAFETAIGRIEHNKAVKKNALMVIIDFSLPSTKERFYVIDLKNKKLNYHTLVAHGRNTGENMAKNFSNVNGSKKSSLGLFVTAETYTGKHGYSLKLDGLDKGINDNARERLIVIHGADYVTPEFAKQQGRLGRSWGCPALPPVHTKKIINAIKGRYPLFAYYE